MDIIKFHIRDVTVSKAHCTILLVHLHGEARQLSQQSLKREGERGGERRGRERGEEREEGGKEGRREKREGERSE